MANRISKPPSATESRGELIERMNLAGREISSAAVMFHTAVAARRGLSATEEKALDILLREGPMTHAALREHTGLAAASVTDLIDRLERKGYAKRAPHPDDRRRVLVAALADRVYADMAPLFVDWVQSLDELYATYTDAQLRTISDFMTQAANRQRVATERLSGRSDSGTSRGPEESASV
jgi:predicted transcriptional regulator